jgi:arylsulfatase A-like enzyme
VPTLAERLAALGYETGAFSGNPTLHAGNGFARGFATFGSTGDSLEAMFLHADAINQRALGWLRAHQYRQPFFLYLHYIDPHDPYENPEIVDNVSRFERRRYTGKLAGRFVHGVYVGRLELEQGERDVEHLTALYDSEVHYVDGRIGELLAAIDPAVLAETLVVLTADHGEELHDHGGWKHGQSLYEEQVHVPLLVRWDGRLAAGRRLPGTVRLLDLVPTLVAAAGGAVDPAWEGIDLLPALTGRSPLPRRPAFTEHLSSGPLRAAAILGRRKLVLFNRRTPFAPADALQEYLWRKDLARLARVELYDLGADPGERRSLAAASGEAPPDLQDAIHRQLDRRLSGLRVMLAGAPPGARVRGRLVCERPPEGWSSYFLADADRVSLSGREVGFELAGESLVKGFLLEGSIGSLARLEIELDGLPLAATALRLGSGAAHPGGPVSEAALLAAEWPVKGGDGPRLHLWRPAAPRAGAAAAPDPETLRRLRALGYVQ